MPIVDVLLPAYNAEATVKAAVDSILAQSLQDFRIIIIDDGSTDGTGKIISGYASHPNVVVISQENAGLVQALNNGLSLTSAKYIARMDADDVSYKIRFERQVEALEADSELVAVGSGFHYISENGAFIGKRYTPPEEPWSDWSWAPASEPYLPHSFLMMRAESVHKIGGYRHCLHSEDADLYWRLNEIGSLKNLQHILGEYRISGGVSSKSLLNGRIQCASSQLAAISARRRAAGFRDIDFIKEMWSPIAESKGIQDMMKLLYEYIDDKEASFFKVATAAKLIDWSLYRGIALSDADIAWCVTVLSTDMGSGIDNRREQAVRLKRLGKTIKTVKRPRAKLLCESGRRRIIRSCRRRHH